MARLSSIARDQAVPKGAVQIVLGGATFVLPLAGVIDVAKEQVRLKKEVERLERDIAAIDRKLADQAFLSKAPPEIVEVQRERREEASEVRARLVDALSRLSSA
jgi:valyl-tRNA synthetase